MNNSAKKSPCLSAPMEITDRRQFLQRLSLAAGGVLLWTLPRLQVRAASNVSVAAGPAAGASPTPYDISKHYWAYAVDTTKCIGCNSCMRACRLENQVPEGQFRTWVERYEIDENGGIHVDMSRNEAVTFDQDMVTGNREGKAPMKAFFVPKICNHCENSPCTQVCPVGASYQTKDGVVLVDKDYCIGCGYCVQACPYGTRFINKETHTADKCTLCYHRITKGLKPACVEVCPVGARIFGDLKDPNSDISHVVREHRYALIKPDMGTHPKCYYLGLDQEVI